MTGNIILVLYLAIVALMIASWWKIFEKADQPGWAAIVPFYNTYTMITKVACLEPLWFWLLLVPFIGLFIAFGLIFVLPFAVARQFGKEAVYGIGLLFLPFVFYPMLAFGDAEHVSQPRRRRSRGRDYSEYEEDEDEDRPRRRRREDDVDEEVERPAKRRRMVDDDEDDRPAPRRRRRDDDD